MRFVIVLLAMVCFQAPLAFGQNLPTPPAPKPEAQASVSAPATDVAENKAPEASTDQAVKTDQSGQTAKIEALEAQLQSLQKTLNELKGDSAQASKTESQTSTPAPSPASTPAEGKDKIEYSPGAIVYVRPFGESDTPPETDFGGFITKDFSINDLKLTQDHKEVSVGSQQRGYDIQGFLKVEKGGLYQFAVDLKYQADSENRMEKFFSIINLEGQQIARQALKATEREQTIRVTGAANLEPGVYKVQIWTGGLVNLNAKRYIKQLAFDIKIKGPGDLNYRTPSKDEILYKKS